MPSEREVVERLLSRRHSIGREQILFYLVLGYLRCRSLDRIFAAEEQGDVDCGCVYRDAGLFGVFSESEIRDVEQYAQVTLAEWESSIERRARRQDRWAGVLLGVFGALLYSLFLVAAYLIWEYRDKIPWP